MNPDIKESNDEDQQSLEDLLKTNPKLETVLFHPDYLNEVMMSNDELFHFLSDDKHIKKMLNYIYYPKAERKGEKLQGHLAFLSFKAISECHLTTTEKIIKSPKYMDIIFSLI